MYSKRPPKPKLPFGSTLASPPKLGIFKCPLCDFVTSIESSLEIHTSCQHGSSMQNDIAELQQNFPDLFVAKRITNDKEKQEKKGRGRPFGSTKKKGSARVRSAVNATAATPTSATSPPDAESVQQVEVDLNEVPPLWNTVADDSYRNALVSVFEHKVTTRQAALSLGLDRDTLQSHVSAVRKQLADAGFLVRYNPLLTFYRLEAQQPLPVKNSETLGASAPEQNSIPESSSSSDLEQSAIKSLCFLSKAKQKLSGDPGTSQNLVQTTDSKNYENGVMTDASEELGVTSSSKSSQSLTTKKKAPKAKGKVADEGDPIANSAMLRRIQQMRRQGLDVPPIWREIKQPTPKSAAMLVFEQSLSFTEAAKKFGLPRLELRSHIKQVLLKLIEMGFTDWKNGMDEMETQTTKTADSPKKKQRERPALKDPAATAVAKSPKKIRKSDASPIRAKSPVSKKPQQANQLTNEAIPKPPPKPTPKPKAAVEALPLSQPGIVKRGRGRPRIYFGDSDATKVKVSKKKAKTVLLNALKSARGRPPKPMLTPNIYEKTYQSKSAVADDDADEISENGDVAADVRHGGDQDDPDWSECSENDQSLNSTPVANKSQPSQRMVGMPPSSSVSQKRSPPTTCPPPEKPKPEAEKFARTILKKEVPAAHQQLLDELGSERLLNAGYPPPMWRTDVPQRYISVMRTIFEKGLSTSMASALFPNKGRIKIQSVASKAKTKLMEAGYNGWDGYKHHLLFDLTTESSEDEAIISDKDEDDTKLRKPVLNLAATANFFSSLVASAPAPTTPTKTSPAKMAAAASPLKSPLKTKRKLSVPRTKPSSPKPAPVATAPVAATPTAATTPASNGNSSPAVPFLADISVEDIEAPVQDFCDNPLILKNVRYCLKHCENCRLAKRPFQEREKIVQAVCAVLEGKAPVDESARVFEVDEELIKEHLAAVVGHFPDMLTDDTVNTDWFESRPKPKEAEASKMQKSPVREPVVVSQKQSESPKKKAKIEIDLVSPNNGSHETVRSKKKQPKTKLVSPTISNDGSLLTFAQESALMEYLRLMKKGGFNIKPELAKEIAVELAVSKGHPPALAEVVFSQAWYERTVVKLSLLESAA